MAKLSDEERKARRRASLAKYKKIVDAGWPNEYQVLCFNCNLAKGFFGTCPHKATH